jgi:hypothetical protein
MRRRFIPVSLQIPTRVCRTVPAAEAYKVHNRGVFQEKGKRHSRLPFIKKRIQKQNK